MLGRVMRSADFELALSSPAKARSAHFAAHHVPNAPSQAATQRVDRDPINLSTMNPEHCAQAVDDAAQTASATHWLGVVVPKRHARRAVTRNLLRRQIRAAILRHERQLAGGMWLVRLRAPFARSDYASATSAALRAAARAELDGLFARAGH
jgi:ribonuclease P protein component